MTRLLEAEETGDKAYLEQLRWELGIIDLVVPPRENQTATGLLSYEDYAKQYGLTTQTREYVQERITETTHPGFRVHYLEFLLIEMEPRGRAWIDLRRDLAHAYREFAEHVWSHIGSSDNGHAGLHIAEAVERLAQLAKTPGTLRGIEHREWAHWIVEVAGRLRNHSWLSSDGMPLEHRWPFEVVENLIFFPVDAIDAADRNVALTFLADALKFYAAYPLAEHFTMRIAEVEYSLRKHFGEENSHEEMIRKQFDALLGRARVHAGTDEALKGHFLRQARRLADQQRQYFTDEELASLQRDEQQAIEMTTSDGTLKPIQLSVQVDASGIDYQAHTAESFVEALITGNVPSIPDVSQLGADARKGMAEHPLAYLFPVVKLGEGKVVGEVVTEEQHLSADVEWRTCVHAGIVGMRLALILARAREECGLQPYHLVNAMREIEPDDETSEILQRGWMRLFENDFISAAHILIPRYEDILRRQLRRMGVETTTFQVLQPETSRTDDATFGMLLRRKAADGRTVEDLLGPDYYNYVKATLNSPTGLNLRNKFAHGLARVGDCSPENVGLVTHLLLKLVQISRGGGAKDLVPNHTLASPAMGDPEEKGTNVE